MTLTFKAGTGGRFASPSFSGLSGVFPTIFIFYSNNLPSTASSSSASSISSL